MKALRRALPLVHREDIGQHRSLEGTAWEWYGTLLKYVLALIAGGLVMFYVIVTYVALVYGGWDSLKPQNDVPLAPRVVTESPSGYWVDPINPRLLPPCVTEDSDNCFYDAPNRGTGAGKGKGRPFYVIDGRVTYLD